MKVQVLREAGYEEALLGLSLSYNQPVEKMSRVANRLYCHDDGHNKFLESITVWLDIVAPRYWWQQFDTYRVGMTKQSESTMHTLMKRPLAQNDFEHPIHPATLERLNDLIAVRDFETVKIELPEGFLQRRVVCTNYKVLRHVITQRLRHRLPEWIFFCQEIVTKLEYGIFVGQAESENHQTGEG
jgi:hypothetical protein